MKLEKIYNIVSDEKNAECFLLYTGNEKYGRDVYCYILNDYKISDITLRVLFYISDKYGLILIKLLPLEENIYVLNRLELFVSSKFGEPIINKHQQVPTGELQTRNWFYQSTSVTLRNISLSVKISDIVLSYEKL